MRLSKYFNREFNIFAKKEEVSVAAAVNLVLNKFKEVAEALDVPFELLVKLDENGVPFLGANPSLLYDRDWRSLRKISPVQVPTTFFVTGDAIDTNNLSSINPKFRKYQSMGMPNSHRIAQSLICKTILDKPLYIKSKPLIPIGIDNYVFASDEDVLNRLFVIKIYEKTLAGKIPKSKAEDLDRAIELDFSIEEKLKAKLNKPVIKQISRIFPNSLKIVFTNEPPSVLTEVGEILSEGKPLAIVQMGMCVHPTYMNFKKNYYLYVSDHPVNVGNGLPDSKKSIKVSILPVMRRMLKVKPPPTSKIKNVILSSGGAAGRIKRMINEVGGIKIDYPVNFIVLSVMAEDSQSYMSLKSLIDKKQTSNRRFELVPKVSLSEYIQIVEKSHAMIGFSGTYTTLGVIAAGRPFGVIFDSRKSKDRIFTDHYKGNAMFIKKALGYPIEIINDSIKKNNLDNLLKSRNIDKAYYQAIKKRGVRDLFIESEDKWHDVFLRLL